MFMSATGDRVNHWTRIYSDAWEEILLMVWWIWKVTRHIHFRRFM